MAARIPLSACMGVVVLSLLLCGCAVYQPQSFWEVTVQTANLDQKNFKVRKLGAQGSATTAYLLGIPMGPNAAGIPLFTQDIQARAMKDLHRNWDGKGSCFFHNVNTEWSNFGLPGILIFHQNTITADIYEYIGEYIMPKTPVFVDKTAQATP
jgi:hypothetical protein